MHATLQGSGVYLTQEGNVKTKVEFDNAQANGDVINGYHVACAMRDIPRLFEPSIYKWRDGSAYGAKHVLEQWRAAKGIDQAYITNGDFTAALVLLGFKVVWRGQKNASFYAKTIP